MPGLLVAVSSYAQEADRIVFKFVDAEVAQGGTKVFRGVEADPRYFRNILVTDFDLLKKSDDYCTATLVGPEAVLTAAHCMVDGSGGLRPAAVQIDGKNWDLACMRSDRQKTDWSFDYLLCRLKPPPNAKLLPGDMFFDSVDTRPVTEDEPVLLVGYGCESMSLDADRQIVPGPKSRSFRIGDEKVAKASGASLAILINSDGSEPALCPGDSGGPLMTGITTKSQEAERSVRGINFSVAGGSGNVKYRSTVVALSHPVFADLLKAWRAANPGALVCEIVGDPAKDHKGRCL
ncbi:trypsin-like serine peptidase [Sphingomonas kyeonggiensis]|uniref:Peptidase S1 domain-containing protein n=1 Tax=Sphingomonas kyeonggiensis TaxID=1268553 RepID=A0A7W6JQ82_9SPHN|nr:trypsin-like serine protease [Sphingomonas kyeonggiensis]MBB4097468.1 hypothetical protein [Sphingomonas kyeonggiensis]